jgi:hypothetical protein
MAKILLVEVIAPFEGNRENSLATKGICSFGIFDAPSQ